jgi:hypothetical protein
MSCCWKCNSLPYRWFQATTTLPPPRHSLLRAEHHPSSGPRATLEGGSGVRTRVQGRPIGASGAEENAPKAADSGLRDEDSGPRDGDNGPRDEDIVNPVKGGDKEEATPRLLEATPRLLEATPHLLEATPHLMEATPGSTVQLPCKIQASLLQRFFSFLRD